MQTSRSTNKTGRIWIRRILLAQAVVALALFTASAHAACGLQNNSSNPRMEFKMPFLRQSGEPSKPAQNQSIVGLWHVTYISGGQLFLETFDQWHADGTEVESANAVPTEGNICMGVWKMIGPRMVQLNHIGWNFDSNGNPIGTFTLQEVITLGKDGASYSGTFAFKIYDQNGSLQFETTGTHSATRITVN